MKIVQMSMVALALFCLAPLYGQFPGIPVGVPGGVPGTGGGPGVPPPPDNIFEGYPNPYANKAVSYQSTYLFTKAELDQIVPDDKIMYGIAFVVDNAQSAILRNFTISIAEVDYDEIPASGINESFTQVYFRTAYTEHKGTNVHVFNEPYCYESGKNLLIQVCVQNGAGEKTFNAGILSNVPDSSRYTAYHDWSDISMNVCGTKTSEAQRYIDRPVTYFFANPISYTDFQARKAENPSGLEFINSVHTPKIWIKNYSCVDHTDYTIGYQIEGGTPHVETPNVLMVRGEVKAFTFSQSITLDKPGFHVMKYWVNHPGDINPANDTLTRLIWVRENKFEGLDYTGTDFWVGFMQNFSNPSTLVQKVFVTTLDTAQVEISLPTQGWSQSLNLLPFEVKSVDIPVNIGGYVTANDKPGIAQPIAVKVTATSEIAVYGLSNVPQSSDAYLAIPTPSLGREYYALAPIGTFFVRGVGELTEEELPAQILLIGTENGTEAKVVLNGPANGKNKGDTLFVSLNEGETYLVKAKVDRLLGIPSNTYDLTGTQIISNHKIGVIGGSQCATVPGYGDPDACQYCDHIMEQATPSSSWGNSYYLTDFAYKPGEDIIRIVNGGFGPTTVNVGGTVYNLTNRGEYIDHKFQGNIRILATNPVQVVQMCTGGQCAPSSSTDPFYINAIPDVQWGSNYTFSTVVSGYFPLQYINVIKRAGEGRVAIDGNMVAQSNFTQVAGTNYYAAKLAVTQGTHMVTSDTTISVSVYGFGKDDGYGFPASGARLVPVNTPPPEIDTEVKDITCFGYKDGEVEVIGSAGTPPYQVIWNDGYIGATRDSLDEGQYVVTLIDDYGYSVRDTVYVAQPDTFIVTVSTDSLSCFETMDGKAVAAVYGGKEPYQNPNWDNGEVDFAIENLEEGDYIFTITDNEGCKAWDTAFVRQPDPIRFNPNLKGVSCNGKNDAKLEIAPSGGNQGYQISFTDAIGDPSPYDNLSPGQYRLTLLDKKGCSLDTQIVVTEPDPLLLSIDEVPSGCLDVATGKIFLHAFGGTPDYNFAAGSHSYQIDSVFDGFSSGTYSVFVRDLNGCFYSNVAEVSTVPVPEFTLDLDHDRCAKEVGEAAYQAMGGTAPYSSEWVVGNDTIPANSISNLGEGSYTLIARDKYCKETIPFEIKNQPKPSFNLDLKPARCGEYNGEINIEMLSFNGYYKHYETFRGEFKDSLINLKASNYLITVSDSLCAVDTVVSIEKIKPVFIDKISVEPQRCNEANGSIDVEIEGGSGNYRYTWYTNPVQYTAKAENLLAGTYTLKVKDDYCDAFFDVAVPEEKAAKIYFSSDDAHCDLNNGAIRTTVLGGSGNFTYTWREFPDSNQTDLKNLDAGWYHLSVFDGTCTVSDSLEIMRVYDFSYTADITPTNCDLDQGQIVFNTTPTDNYTYNWLDFPGHTSNQKSDLDSGLVRVDITKGRCTYLFRDKVPMVPNPRFVATTYPSTCDEANGAIKLDAVTFSGDKFFFDADDNPIADSLGNLLAGKYLFKVSDGICTIFDSLEIPAIAPPALDYTVTDETCNKGNGEITGTGTGVGNVSIVWADNFSSSFSRSGLSAGNYPYQISDDNCTMLDTALVSNNPASPLILQDGKLDATCNLDNGYIKVKVSGPEAPYTYSWSGAGMGSSLEQKDLAPGVYFLTVKGAVCTERVPFVVRDIPPITLNPEVIKNADCGVNSGVVALHVANAAGNYDIQILGKTYPNVDTIFNLPPGVHDYILSDDFCTESGSIAVPTGLNLTYTVNRKDEFCLQNDGVISVNVNTSAGDLDISWADDLSNKNLSRSGLAAGNYSFTISDSLCSYTKTVSLVNQKAPSGEIEILQSEACNQGDGMARFKNLKNTDSFRWMTGNNSAAQISGLSAGEVSVDLINAYCTVTIKGEVNATKAPELNVEIDPEYCDLQNGSITLQPTVELSHRPYYFEDGDGNKFTQNFVGDLKQGLYNIKLVDNRGCEVEAQYLVDAEYTKMNGGNIYFMPNPPNIGSELLLSANLPPGWKAFEWAINGYNIRQESPRYTLQSDSTVVVLIGRHLGGCLDSLSIQVFADRSGTFYFPNAFSPDNDGINDRFYPVTKDIVAWKGNIFNRWGELIYTFTHEDEPWQGTYHGEPVQQGTYPVVFTYIRLDGSAGRAEGMVTIIK